MIRITDRAGLADPLLQGAGRHLHTVGHFLQDRRQVLARGSRLVQPLDQRLVVAQLLGIEPIGVPRRRRNHRRADRLGQRAVGFLDLVGGVDLLLLPLHQRGLALVPVELGELLAQLLHGLVQVV